MHQQAIHKAKAVDAKYNGWDKNSDVQGPMAQILNDFGKVEGLLVGAHNEIFSRSTPRNHNSICTLTYLKKREYKSVLSEVRYLID